MSNSIEEKMKILEINLPEAPAPAANYVPFVIPGNHVYISGQVSADQNGFICGKLGSGMSIEDGYEAARRCKKVVKLTGFVNCTADFSDQPKVVNGASDLMFEVFESKGKHARSAVGTVSLPLGVAVEVEGIFELS